MVATMRRRSFLQQSALVSVGTSAAPIVLRAAAPPASKGDRVLVVLQLSGGNDGLNTVVPHADDTYYDQRFTIAVPKPQVRRIDDHIGFHPALEGYSDLLEAGRLAVVQGIGYPNPNRSHFSSMDIWHTARATPGPRDDGWLGAAADRLPARDDHSVVGLHLGGGERPRALHGRVAPIPSVRSLRDFQLDLGDRWLETFARDQAEAAATGGGNDLLDYIRATSRAAIVSSRQVRQVLGDGPGPVRYPPSDTADHLRTVARLIDAGLGTRVYYLSVGGFDTHANQRDAHAGLLRRVAEASRAFLADLAARGQLDRVLLMTFSEFGRRIRENGTKGTDHGTAAPLFLAGGKVAAGPHGEHPSLTDTDQGDLKFHTDFRRVYATVLDRWLSVDSEAILGAAHKPLPVLST